MRRTPDALIVTREDVRRLLTLDQCITAVEEAFRLHGLGAVPTPGIHATHVGGGGFHVKAGAMPFEGRWYYAVKANANFPGNESRTGLPTIQGIVALFDAECGLPLAMMDSIEITILRTAAATAVAAKHLARPDSSAVTIVGCGQQARSQLAALAAVLPLRAAYAIDVDGDRARRFATDAGAALRMEIRAASDLVDAARRSDAIVTCTPSRAPLLMSGMVRPGTFVAAVGADHADKQELDPALLARSRVVPDVIAQAAAIGELHHALTAGVVDLSAIAGGLGDVVAGRTSGRRSADEITIFDSTGMALQDVAAACAIYKAAAADPAVRTIPLAT